MGTLIPRRDIQPTPLELTGNPFSIPDVERLFLFDGNLNEETAGSDLFSTTVGSAQYRDSIFPGMQCLYLDGFSVFEYDATETNPYEQTGAMSIVAVTAPLSVNPGYIMSTSRTAGDQESYNNLWSLKLQQTYATEPSQIIAFHESGAGTNQEAVSERGPRLGEWSCVGWTRPTAATSYTFYEAGLPAGVDTGLAAPTGGSDSFLALGGFSGGGFEEYKGYVALIAFWWEELTAEQMRKIDKVLMGR